jgi:hypothetical protein
MTYSSDTNILLWVDDKYLSDMAKKIAKELRLTVWEVEVESDIYGVPYFMAIIDSRNFNDSIMENLEEMYSPEYSPEGLFLLTSKLDLEIPIAMYKLFFVAPEIVTTEWLKTTIINTRNNGII